MRKSTRRRRTAGSGDQITATLKAFARALDMIGWRKRNHGLWLQAQRVVKLITKQSEQPDGCFPPGNCFIHANVPTVNSFCIKRIVEIDLSTATLFMDIYGDEELQEGSVLLPLEAISWFGFPGQPVLVSTVFAGFTLPKGTAPVVVPPS